MLLNEFERKEKIKTVITTIVISLFVVVLLWSCLFITDYLMFINSKPTVFTISKMEKTEIGKRIYEDGLCYSIVTDENNGKTLYLFNKQIKSK